MRSRRFRFMVPAMLVLSLVGASLAIAASQGPKHQKDQNQFKAVLIGHNEVPATHSAGQGRLSLTINADNTMSFELTYSDLSNAATVAHIHFGQPNVNGAVSFFFCGGGVAGSVPKPACPAGTTAAGPATVTGTITATDVGLIAAQLTPAGDLGAIIDEIRDGFAYANVHTAVSPGGEIRGQVDEARGHGGGHHDDDD